MRRVIFCLIFCVVGLSIKAQHDITTTDSIVYRNYESGIDKWYVSAKYLYAHESNSNKITERVWVTDPENGSYELKRSVKNIYDFDDQGNMTALESYEWVDAISEWFGMEKITFEYNSNNVLLKKTIYDWDYDLVIWEPITEVNYFPSDGSGVGVKNQRSKSFATIYPNPAKNFVMVKVGTNHEAKIELFDIHGRPLLKKEFERELFLSLQNFNPGVYIYRVRKGVEVQKGEVIIK